MRWVFVALVLANAGVFFWHSVESSRLERLEALNTSSDDGRGVKSGAPLVLVSELTEEEKQELMTAKEAPPAKKMFDAESSATPAIQDAVAANPETNVVNKIDATTASTIDETEQDATPVVAPNQCLKIGPFLNTVQMEQVSQRLMAVTIITEVTDTDVPGKPEYWVILPPFGDEKIALQKLQELQGRALQPQIIPKGPLANAISFGLRGEKSEADKLAEELKAKGIRVEVRAVPTSRKEKWLALSERQTPKLTGQLWEEIHADFPKLDKQIRNCH